MNRDTLQGKKILVTRQTRQAQSVIQKLQQSGAEVYHAPLIKFKKVYTAEQRGKIENLVKNYDWLFFTSENGVRFFMDAFKEFGPAISTIKNLNIAAVGKKTTKALHSFGLTVNFQPTTFNGQSFVEEFIENYGTNSKIAILCGKKSRKEIPYLLTEASIIFDKIVLYDTITNKEIKSYLNTKIPLLKLDAAMFTSPSTVEAFTQLLDESTCKRLKQILWCVAIGTTTADVLEELGFKNISFPDEFTTEAMIELMDKNFCRNGAETN